VPSIHSKVLAFVEVMIVFAVIAFLLVSAVPAFLRARKRWRTSKIVILARSSNPLATV
jgi:type II secretory pathway pseudopilin PulG